MQVQIEQRFHIECSSREFLLICKALGCSLTEPELIEAEELGNNLTRLKAGVIKSMIALITIHV